MLLIYTPKLNSRIDYAIEVCFKHVVKLDYRITSDLVEFEKSTDPCLWYAQEKVSKKPGIIADAMMFDNKILINSPGRVIEEGIMVLFPTETVRLAKFDLFAATFWHVTRMEEYECLAKDVHHRFNSEMSIARKIGILQKPIVNIWVKLILDELSLLYPDLSYEKPSYKFLPTIDVDSIYMYKSKGLYRTLGGIARDILRKNFPAVKKRFHVLLGKEPDPWFCFDKIIDLHHMYQIKPSFFFLVAKHGALDKNISPKRKTVKNIVGELAQNYTIGIHTSYKGNKNPKLWSHELKVIKRLTSNEIFSSRQHYLYVTFPETYNNLINLGIKRDFSMVYPDMTGFRMGTTVPVPFYNLETNTKTDLWLYPTMIMDVSLKDYQNLDIDDAIIKCLDIVNYTKEFGGTLVTLWHNEALSEFGEWEGWNQVYEKIMEAATAEVEKES